MKKKGGTGCFFQCLSRVINYFVKQLHVRKIATDLPTMIEIVMILVVGVLGPKEKKPNC